MDSGQPLLAVALAVGATRPAAGSALTFVEFLDRAPDTAYAGLVLLGVLDPADELVASQRRDVRPRLDPGRVVDQRRP